MKNYIVKYNNRDSFNEDLVGKKAMGLRNVPSRWSLPFFVVSSEVYELYKNCNSEKKKLDFISNIGKEVENEVRNEFGEGKIIIRSSGVNESIEDRGKYNSKECMVDKIGDTLNALFEELYNLGEETKMAYVIQPFIDAKKKIHISNERRISSQKRDWVMQIENDIETPEEESFSNFGIRNWRDSYDSNSKDKALMCDKKEIKNVIRTVASYYTNRKERVHLEIIWDGKCLYIVQCDNDVIKHGINPKDLEIKINRGIDSFNFTILREINSDDAKEYQKIHNVHFYEELGINVPPIYIMDNRDEIEALVLGEPSAELVSDLEKLVKNSMIIRTDYRGSNIETENMLPRSNELRSVEEVKFWAKQNLTELLKSKKNIVLLIHIFIPSIASAFAYSKPNSRVVIIQSLWGIPEGLYYNAHDTTYIDTVSTDVELMDKNTFEIRKKPSYKERYYTTNPSGNWEECITNPNYDWNYSLTKNQIKEIAFNTRRIAQKEGKSISVMWFAGVDKEYYKSDCIPWHHEDYDEINIEFRKKYITDEFIEIRNDEDLETIKKNKTIKYIKIHPNTEECMRDKVFLKKVGEYASKENITIIIEGATLAHPYYALKKITKKIIVIDDIRESFAELRFNKLVRDRIPEKINNHLEKISCKRATHMLHKKLLIEKLIEEAHEVLIASNNEELVEEIADLLEVLYIIKEKFLNGENLSDFLIKKKQEAVEPVLKSTKIFEIEGANFINEEYSTSVELKGIGENIFCNYRANKEGKEIRNEFVFGENDNYIIGKIDAEKSRIELLQECYAIQGNTDDIDIKKSIETIEKKAETLLIKHDISRNIIEKKRMEKRKKKGGFNNGFVLLKTRVSNGTFFDEENIESISSLPFATHSIYVDARKIKNNSKLIIRVFLPIDTLSWHFDCRSTKVQDFFNAEGFIRLYFSRTGINFRIKGVFIYENKTEQMKFDFDRKI